MKCYDCKSNYTKKKGEISLSNNIIGNFEVHNVTYYKCPDCNKLLFHSDTAVKIEKKEREIKLKLLNQLPVQDFISASQTAYLLNITKQALHKNVRIKNGFIYSIELDGKKLYNKKSALLFKEKRDGRFLLNKTLTEQTKYIIFAPDCLNNFTRYNNKKILNTMIWNKTNTDSEKLYKYI
ncbi:MAG: hypothetical protein JRJ49_07755 [Deltaproteobacteria bacterium]|nr:hypothetical protein [Deltaproteobacteria bacterium]